MYLRCSSTPLFLKIHTGEPTNLYTDNVAALQGSQMDNVPADQRYLAARRAVLRQAAIEVEEKVMRLLKVATNDNPSEIFNKPVECAQFLKLRAIIMGVSDLEASAPLAAARESDIECVHFLAGLEADSSLCKQRGVVFCRKNLASKTKTLGSYMAVVQERWSEKAVGFICKSITHIRV